VSNRGCWLGFVLGVLLSVVLVAGLVIYAQTRPLTSPRLPGQNGREQLRITADETLLSVLVSKAAREQDPAMEDVVVDVRPGGWLDVVLGAQVTVAGQTASVQLKVIGALSVTKGRLQLSVAQIVLAGMPISVDLLPGVLRDRMDKMVSDANEMVSETLLETGFQVVAANTDETTLSVSMALAEE